jgi:hypothetical protein
VEQISAIDITLDVTISRPHETGDHDAAAFITPRRSQSTRYENSSHNPVIVVGGRHHRQRANQSSR